MQALWAIYDDQMVDLTLPFLGEERSRWQYPFGAIHRAGGRLVAGSDWPVSTPDPLAAIHTAVTRTSYGEAGRAGTEPFLPEQALDLETAFAAYTSGSAWVNHRDDAGWSSPAPWPTSWCWTGTRSPDLRRRSARPGWCPRGWTASGSGQRQLSCRTRS